MNRGKGGYGYLALEAGQPIRATDLSGNHDTATRRLQYWLDAPGVKPDGDFVDGAGGFEYGKTMKWDIGWYHDGTHPQTGRVLYAMAEHFFLTGDKEWFQKNRGRMQEAADWIIRQRTAYLEGIPRREQLAVAGLQPPQMLGDIGLGMCAWRWFFIHDAFSLQGLRRFADALAEFDPEAGRKYRVAAEAYADDLRRIVEHLDVVEELLKHGKNKNVTGVTPELFWTGFAGLVKYMCVDTTHLRRDDVPCFLRSWANNYAAWVTVEGGLPEPPSLLAYQGNPAGKPKSDLGSTGWFVASFRNLLVMEDGQSLWLARATPRAWLEQGEKISVKNAPTYFGTVAYEIVSDVDNGTINATIELPSRKAPNAVVLRFRHPTSAPIKAITVDGKPWTEFDAAKETITLKGLSGTVAVQANYR